jgi:uncharacterized protein
MKRAFDCDPTKRQLVLLRRNIDLLDVAAVFLDENRIDMSDSRNDYGEERRVTIGKAMGRTFTLVYTERPPKIWLITAWPSSRKERALYDAGRNPDDFLPPG